MGTKQNLDNQEAVAKIKELAEDKICLFCTYENDTIVSRPMSTQQVDEDGNLWFISKRSSEKNEQLKEEDHVHLMYMDTSKQHYLSLTGIASIVYDEDKIDQLWTPIAKAWFEKGKEDPELCLIRVSPTDGHYWDTKNGKLISMLKIAVAAVTGKTSDGGVDGALNV